MKKKKPRPTKAQRMARRMLRENHHAIVLHTLYGLWGLPTKRLAPLFK